jgi:hypothetical protein
MHRYRSLLRPIRSDSEADYVWLGDGADRPPLISVIEDRSMRDTGLVDHQGIPIVDVSDSDPVGFMRFS